jgi:predicted nucleic acid-binding protein
MATLNAVLEIERLLVDDAVAEAWAAMRVQLAERGRKVNVNDLWIAATAVANELPVYARDIDYLALVDIGGPSFIRV